MRLVALIDRLLQRLLEAIVRGYRLLLKPWLGSACRFEPTCSAYALQALEQRGGFEGGTLTAWRLLRCHPWCEGGLDPLEPSNRRPGLFTRWLREASPDDTIANRP